MPGPTDAVYLPQYAYLGTSDEEWLSDRLECDGRDHALMYHLPTSAAFIVEMDPEPTEGMLQFYAFPIKTGGIDPRDREAIVLLGRGAIWYYCQRDPEIKAGLARLAAEERIDGRVS